MTTFYRLCDLKKGDTVEVAWIPEQYAVVGKVLEIQKDNGWKVTFVGHSRRDGQYLANHERDYAGHRQRTDI